jgi:hypothetical protein
MNKLLIVCASLSLCFTACRSDDNDGNTPDGGGSAADAAPGSSTTIYDVQSDNTPEGSAVTLRSVVVTAIDTFGSRTGGIYVQEVAGGAFSGVFIFGASSTGLAVGDLVDVDNGVKTEFSFDFIDGHSLTQVTSPDGGAVSVTKVGTGTAPTPEVLNSWDLAADEAEAEKWEGVLVKFDGMRVLRSADGVSSTDATLKEMTVTGPFRIGGSLADLTGQRDDCYTSITGIGDYFFNYKILPRSPADIVAGGTNCLPEETTLELCGDTMDNDYNGFNDCADFSCQGAQAVLCTVETTVVEAQGGTIAENSLVRLTDVIVTAVSADNKKFWVQDDTAAAALNGIYVFRPSDADPLTSNYPGKKVTLLGNLDEFNGQLTELTNVIIEAESTPSNNTIRTLSGVSLADLSTMKDYEGVLVEVSDVSASAAGGTCGDFNSFTITDGTTTTQANELISCHEPVADTCYGTFTGVMHFDDFDTTDDSVDNPPGIVILPLTDGLNTAGGTCN